LLFPAIAPTILSEEVTKEGKEGEINWSIGTYVERFESPRQVASPRRMVYARESS
jgi:hypothetical protein